MPRLWDETIESHRRAVRDAILDSTWALVTEHGLRAVSMSRIAEHARIGRATLYKYFGDVDAILRAWHQRQLQTHLQQLVAVRDQARDPAARLHAVLAAYARNAHGPRRHRDTDLTAWLHRDPSVGEAQRQLHQLLRDLIRDAVDAGAVRTDVPPGELASYCLNALAAAGGLASSAAVDRLVSVTLAGLRPLGSA